LLWFVKKNEDGEDAELLIGVYSGETEAMAAIERLKGRAGFAEFPQGFEIHPYEIDHDPWIEGFVRG
jgi:hypothetical protein